jgi:catechol 2,3-dioxygenase-like lactoylglutathione lyase family enzyme
LINAVHSILFARDAEAAREFFADVLGLRSVDAGGGWLIFALPPAELAVHPAEGEPRQELYLMTDDLEATLAALRERGVRDHVGAVRPGMGGAGEYRGTGVRPRRPLRAAAPGAALSTAAPTTSSAASAAT